MRGLPSCPTRRSSDLAAIALAAGDVEGFEERARTMMATGRIAPFLEGMIEVRDTGDLAPALLAAAVLRPIGEDRKSTRLNSSHPSISYAVFGLKKKNAAGISTDFQFAYHPGVARGAMERFPCAFALELQDRLLVA